MRIGINLFLQGIKKIYRFITGNWLDHNEEEVLDHNNEPIQLIDIE